MYAPEMGAPTSRLTSLAKGLVKAGNEVTVATGMPNYPSGTVYDGYRKKLWMTEELDGVRIVRSHYLTCPRNQNKWIQLLSYLSFLPAVFFSCMRAGKADVVIVSSPPIFPICVGIVVSFIKRAKLVFDLRDLWPDEIVACGGASAGSIPVRMIGLVERLGYRCSNAVFCTTESFKDRVTQRGARANDTYVIPNGADTTLFRPIASARSAIRTGHGVEEKTVVMYSGAIGLKHGLDVVIDAAEKLRQDDDIVFVFVGNGAAREHLEAEVAKRNLSNVQFWGERPLEEIPAMLSAADICITSLLPEPYLECILAVKIFEYMACGKPVAASVAGESGRVVTESGAGLVTPPGDGQQLADAIRKLWQDRDHRNACSKAGPEFIESRFSRSAIAEQAADILKSRFGRNGSSG